MFWNIILFKLIILGFISTAYINGMTHEEALLRCTQQFNTLKEDNRHPNATANKEVFVLLEKIIQNLRVNKDKDWWQDYLNCQKGLEVVAWLSINSLKPSHHKEISPRVENTRIENKEEIKKIVKKHKAKLVFKKKAKNHKIKLASKKR